jgi:hypothetical protein
MKPHIRNPSRGNGNPFDGSAPARLARMKLLTPDNKPNAATLPVYAGIFSANFFDAITDFYDDRVILQSICDTFNEYLERRDYERMLVFLCIQHDAMFRTLPDPLWWICGVPELIEAFLDCFIVRLSELVGEVEM